MVVADLFAKAPHPGPPDLRGVRARRGQGRLRGPGLYAANGDGPPRGAARAQVATVRSVFLGCLPDRGGGRAARPQVRQPDQWPAADHGLPVAGAVAARRRRPVPGRVLHGSDADRFTAAAKPVTDATATPSPAAPPGAFVS